MTLLADADRVAPAGAAQPARRFARRGDGLPLVLSAVLTALAVVALVKAPAIVVNGYGLLPALPIAYLIALGLLIAVFLGSLLLGRTGPRVLYLQVVVIVVVLALAPGILEPYARFPTAYTHVGFVDYIAQNGHVLKHYDARFSWPGFFAVMAALAKAAGVSAGSLLRWTPLTLDLLYLVPLAALTRSLISDPRRRALALFIFVIGNWLGQDYFAPQGLNFFLFLVFMALLVHVFRTAGPDSRLGRLACRVLRRESESEEAGSPQFSPGLRAAGLAGLLLIFSASVVSHQLTPFFMLLAVIALALLGATQLRSLPVLMAVLIGAFFVWAAGDYWHGHLHDLFGGLGHLGSSLHQNVGARASTASDPARTTVVDARLLLTALVWGLGLIGLWRCRSRSLVPITALAIAPFFVLGLQSYGGEAALRAQFFALPFVAMLAAHVIGARGGAAKAASPARRRFLPNVRWLRPVATGLVALVLSAALPAVFMLARYGNESFEQSRPGDVAAVAQLYSLAPAGSVIFSLNDALPWKYEKVGSYVYEDLIVAPWLVKDPATIFAPMARVPGHAYLIVTDGQWSEVRELGGVSPADLSLAQNLVRSTPLLHRVYGSGNTAIYEFIGGKAS